MPRIKNPIPKKSDKTKISGGGVTKPKRRFRPGTVAIREIRKYQKTTDTLIPRMSFQRYVREIMGELGPYRIQTQALYALQEAAEAYLVEWFEKVNTITCSNKRVTLLVRDVRCLSKIEEKYSNLNDNVLMYVQHDNLKKEVNNEIFKMFI